jgi:hypothetical protein
MFQRRIAIGSQGYPFSLTDRQYAGGLCPVTERLYYKELLEFEICSYQLADKDMDYVINAFHKVYENKDDLAGI